MNPSEDIDACEHYDENPDYSILSWVLGATVVLVGGAVVTYSILTTIS